MDKTFARADSMQYCLKILKRHIINTVTPLLHYSHLIKNQHEKFPVNSGYQNINIYIRRQVK